jgi:isoquinoline 1-oxidoreductase beta subunit
MTFYSRRRFLKTSATAAGSLLVAFHLPDKGQARGALGRDANVFAPNAFVRIDTTGRITLTMPQVEMGQGIHTAHAMIIAEELDVSLAQVELESSAPSDSLYGNPIFHLQVTGNSNSVRAFFMPLRTAGATARALLVEAAAKQWRVDPSACRTEQGTVIHDVSARRAAYGRLATRAARITLETPVSLKRPLPSGSSVNDLNGLIPLPK